MDGIKIRKGNEQDAKGVIEVGTYTWLTTYKGLVPDKLLENRVKTMSQRISEMTKLIRRENNLYVADDNGKIVGFAIYGASRNAEYDDCGEIYAIYVLKDYQGIGLGKKLFMKGLEKLIERGFNSMILNVLDGNETINFYKKYGGIEVGFRRDDFDGIKLLERIIYFSDIKKILLMNKWSAYG